MQKEDFDIHQALELYDEFMLLEQANQIYKVVCDNKYYNDETRNYLITAVNLFRLAAVYKRCIDNFFSIHGSEEEFIENVKLGCSIAAQEDYRND
jgi:hypothetical protein